jgi:hypothetical protein
MNEHRIEGPRGCTKGDLDELISLVNGIFRPEGSQDVLTDYPLVYEDQNLSNIRMIRLDDQLVSEVPFIPWTVVHEGCRFTIGVISPTATHSDHRHKGYGLLCLNSCVACMVRQKIDLSVLWTLVETFKFYNHAAFEGVRDQGYTFPCGCADASRFEDHGEQVVAYDRGSRRFLSDMMLMHEAEPFGFVRSEHQAAALYSLPLLTTHLALRGGQPVAYLCISRSSNKPGIIEAGGDVEGVETLVHHALAQLPDRSRVRIHTSLCQTVLYQLMQAKAADLREGSGENMMLRINDIPGFFRRIAPWLERRNAGRNASISIRVTDAEETVSLQFQNGKLMIGAKRTTRRLEMTRLELTSALFGAHPARPFEVPKPLESLFPFYFPIAVLDRS